MSPSQIAPPSSACHAHTPPPDAQLYQPGRVGRYPGEISYLLLPGGVPILFCWCQPGWLDYQNLQSEKPYRAEGFWMGKYLVTQRQWAVVMGKNPSNFPEEKHLPEADDYPVDSISWDDSRDFCKQSTIGLYLPGEAEWEYACRAGTVGDFAVGAGKALNSQLANFDGQHPHGGGPDSFVWQYAETTKPVGRYPANLFGIHDMHGQLWEWCFDAIDGPRVLRGGSWITGGVDAGSGTRDRDVPGFRSRGIGLRVCPSPSGQEKSAGGDLRSRAAERGEGRAQ